MTAPVMRGRVYWQQECTCGHQRGYHVNQGTGSCAGQPAGGKAFPCQEHCMAFADRPQSEQVEKWYGPAPVGDPKEFVRKRVRHKDIDAEGLCIGLFSFSDDSNLMCQVEWEAREVDPRTGRRPKFTSLHYAGNLELAEDDEWTPAEDDDGLDRL